VLVQRLEKTAFEQVYGAELASAAAHGHVANPIHHRLVKLYSLSLVQVNYLLQLIEMFYKGLPVDVQIADDVTQQAARIGVQPFLS
jgi:hypothetical protein